MNSTKVETTKIKHQSVSDFVNEPSPEKDSNKKRSISVPNINLSNDTSDSDVLVLNIVKKNRSKVSKRQS